MYSFAHAFLLLNFFFLAVVGGMDEVGVLAVYLQDVHHHLPNEFGQG